MKKIILIILPLILMFSACALEIANVIGPSGGWVFHDKGSYSAGWRYMECRPNNLGELDGDDPNLIKNAIAMCETAELGGWQMFPWELPDNHQIRTLLSCFTYGLTQFSPDPHYLSVIRHVIQPDPDIYFEEIELENGDTEYWQPVIYHMSFSNSAFGELEIVYDGLASSEKYTGPVRIRPIRRF